MQFPRERLNYRKQLRNRPYFLSRVKVKDNESKGKVEKEVRTMHGGGTEGQKRQTSYCYTLDLQGHFTFQSMVYPCPRARVFSVTDDRNASGAA